MLYFSRFCSDFSHFCQFSSNFVIRKIGKLRHVRHTGIIFRGHSSKNRAKSRIFARQGKLFHTLPYLTLPYPNLTYPTLPYPTLNYPNPNPNPTPTLRSGLSNCSSNEMQIFLINRYGPRQQIVVLGQPTIAIRETPLTRTPLDRVGSI